MFTGDIPIDDSPHDDIISGILERAKKEAEEHAPGEEFGVEMNPEEMLEDVNPMEIVGPVMMRAHEYGLMAGPFFDATFHFTKIN